MTTSLTIPELNGKKTFPKRKNPPNGEIDEERKSEKQENKNKSLIKTILQGTGITGAIVGVIGTLITTQVENIIDKQHEIVNTYELYTTQFEDPLLKKSREKIESTRYKILYQHPNLPPEIIQEESEKIGKDIIQLVNYYRKVTECVDEGICDEDTAKVLFSRTITNFNATFAPYLCKQDAREWLEKNKFRKKTADCSIYD